MSKETVNFKIGLSGSFSNKKPEFSILLGDKEYYSGSLSTSSKKTEYFSFDAELEQGNNVIVIKLKNKSSEDTLKDDNNNILQDMLLNIDSIEVDEINLSEMLWTHSEYYPEYPSDYVEEQAQLGKNLDPCVKYCVNLGWNGKWTLPFQSPLYIWLLDNI